MVLQPGVGAYTERKVATVWLDGGHEWRTRVCCVGRAHFLISTSSGRTSEEEALYTRPFIPLTMSILSCHIL